MPPRNAQSRMDDDTRQERDPSLSGPWVAVTNLSVSRATGSDKVGVPQAAIVHANEELPSWVDDDQIHGFLTRHRTPVIRRKGDHDADRSITARHLFGKAPGAAAFGAREDPPGASRVEVVDPGPRNPADPMSHPEAHDPQTDLNVDPDAKKDR